MQLTLTFEPPAARCETSRAAAAAVKPTAAGVRELVLQFIRQRGRHGATDHEVSRSLGLCPDTTRARRVELRDAGDVRDSGTTRPSPTGRAATVWIAGDVAGDDRRPGANHEIDHDWERGVDWANLPLP